MIQKTESSILDIGKSSSRKMEVLTYNQFSVVNGVPDTPPSFSEMHRYPRRPSKSSQIAMSRLVLKQMSDWQDSRDRLRVQFEALKAEGAIREPTRTERLERTAQGEGPAAEAARRLLARPLHVINV